MGPDTERLHEQDIPEAIKEEDDKVVDQILEEQIAAQEAGDAEAAKRAAENSAYPAAVEDRAFPPVEDGEPDTNEAPGPKDVVDENQPPPPGTGLLDDMTIQLLRLANGEWILGQFKVVADPEGNSMMAYHKAFRFAAQPGQDGKMAAQVAPWPVVAGTIELTEIAGTGFVQHGWDGMNVEELYKQLVSPVAIAGRRQMNEEVAKKRRAEAILNAGKRAGNGPRR